MIDSFFLIAAGFSALILIFFAAGAAASFFPALAIYTGTLWFSFFRWGFRMLLKVIGLAIVVVLMIVVFGPG